MQPTEADAPNVKAAVPFFRVTDMAVSLRFYTDGLGFRVTKRWEPDGQLRWCWLDLGSASIMLQTLASDADDRTQLGRGVTVCFTCADALAIYRDACARGLSPREPFVGNGLWVTGFVDPNGYRLEFSSPTDAPEETTLSEWERRARS